jgi:hypothetical protein
MPRMVSMRVLRLVAVDSLVACQGFLRLATKNDAVYGSSDAIEYKQTTMSPMASVLLTCLPANFLGTITIHLPTLLMVFDG